MSLGHSEVSFNHSCLKVPVDSRSRRPSPKYERVPSAKRTDNKKVDTKKEYPLSNLYNNFKSVKSYLEFYESIPDYSELHHLSNEEFYSRLKSLKITQKRFCGESGVLSSLDLDEECKPLSYCSFNEPSLKKLEDKRPERCCCCSACSPDKDFCCCSSLYEKKPVSKVSEGVKPPNINIISDNENASDLFEVKKHSGYEADQESSTLQMGEKTKRKVGDDFLFGNCSRRSRSLPLSPGCECETPEFCRGFSDLSFRNEGCHSTYGSGYYPCDNLKKSALKKPKKLSHVVPITSRIPLYDKIMTEKETRRRILHDQYSEELRSLVKPFSFTKREEEREKRRMFCSNPELRSLNIPQVRFKAKPIPKNLFSNYAYERMREEEFYRALKRRIRAEEMLKSSSLPPSMALREKMKYRSKSLDYLDCRSSKKSWNKACGYRNACKSIKRGIELDEKNKCVSTKRRLRSSWLSNNRRINSATDSSTEISPYGSILDHDSRQKSRPHSAVSCSRNNLASVLRIETARKRMEKEMEEKLREVRMKNEAKFKARLVRMTPAWRALNTDKDEDLALRMAARKEEERIKQQNHQRLMESMYGRVSRMPPLFHKERLLGTKVAKNKNSGKDSDCFSYNEATETKDTEVCEEEENPGKTFEPETPKAEEENDRSRKSSESTGSGDKSEKAKIYESDNTI